MLERNPVSEVWVRACAYFTVLQLLGGRRADVDSVWAAVGRTENADGPSSEYARVVAEAAGVTPAVVMAAYRNLRMRMRALERATVLERGTVAYPPSLANTADAPEFVFVVGASELLHRPAIAVVGTRQASEQGRLRARKLGYLLAKRGIVVNSGLALGIDEAAHGGALAAGGPTVAVLGTPVDRAYPRQHAKLQALIAETGALVSQFYPGQAVQRHFFPMRNAVMSGLSVATVVIEASETSGALIQARKCLQQGRKLFIPQSAVERQDLTWPRTYLQRANTHAFRAVEELLAVLESEDLIPREGGPSTVIEGAAAPLTASVH